MIILNTMSRKNPRTGRKELLVDSAWNEDTFKPVIMDDTPVHEIPAAYFCQDRASWVMPSDRR